MIFSPDLPIAEVLVALGDDFRYYPIFVHATGNVNAGILLASFIRWQGKQKDPEGWIYKSAKAIHEETGLTQAQQETAVKHLKKLQLLRDENRGTPCTKHFLFDWHAVTKLCNQWRQSQAKAAPPLPDALLASDLPEPLLKTMCRKFDEVFARHANGHSFEWGSGKDSRERGRQMQAMKNLRDAVGRRCRERKENIARKENGGELPADFEAPVTELEVLHSWEQLLDYLPPYHIERHLNPVKLYANFSDILKDVTKHFRATSGTPGANRRTAAAGDVGADSI